MDLIVQARTSSNRLPNKILYNCKENYNFLEYFYKRCRMSKKINRIIIATTTNNRDDIICDICQRNNWLYFRGSENDVLERFYMCAKKFKCNNIIRVTSDCPLIDYRIIDDMIDFFLNNNADYLETKYYGKHGFPDGLNPGIFSIEALELAQNNSNDKSEREHIIPYFNKKLKKIQYDLKINKNKYQNINFEKLHLSLDTKQDLINLRNIVNYFKHDDFTYIEMLIYLNNIIYKELDKYYI